MRGIHIQEERSGCAIINTGKKLFRVSPMVEYKVHYNKNPHLGISAGLNVALQLKEKSAKLAVE